MATTSLAERVRSARIALGLTQDELAARCSLSGPYISLLETGKRGDRVPFATAGSLALALGVSVGWLVCGDEPREAA